MFSYQHITNRNEFIQQFREDRGLNLNLSHHSNKMEKTENRSLSKQPSRVNTSVSVKSKQNSSLNLTNHNANNSNEEGRWEYLYQLEKLKRRKLDEKRSQKQEQLYHKDLEECTFSPKLNKLKINQGCSGIGLNNLSNFSGVNINNHNKIKNNSNSNGNSIMLHKDNSKNSDSLLERQKSWEYKKNMKIENIKQNQINKDNQECLFVPKLNPPTAIKRIDISQLTKNLIVDPESYSAYVSRRNKHRNEINQDNKREKSLPGSGNIWVNKPTKPVKLNLITDSNGSNKSLQIKSLNKPVVLNKFHKIKNNYKVGDARIDPSINNLVDLIYAPKEKNTIDELEAMSQNGIKIEKMEFGHALKNLHEELHSIDLKGYEK